MRDYIQEALEACKANKSFRHLLEEFFGQELLDYKRAGVKGVEICSASNETVCKECVKMAGKKFTVEEAIKIMPLPVKACEMDLYENGNAGYCRCIYLPLIG